MRIGIFGGTFDPIHVGHLVAAWNARAALDLDEVALVVANEPWQKIDQRRITPAPDRLALVEAAVEGLGGLVASSVEIDRGGPSFTIDTVRAFQHLYEGAELFLVVGADVAGELDTWKCVDELKDAVCLVVVNRPGAPTVGSLAGWRASGVEIPALEISSTDLRARVASGRPLDFLVPSAAIRVIADRGLYASKR